MITWSINTQPDHDDKGEEVPNIWSKDKAANITKAEIITYITDRINDYEERGLKDNDLFEYWQVDFENFTSATYKRTTTSTKQLRDYLLDNSV